jgi:hypothetical protein
MISTIIYRVLTSPYVRFVRVADGFVWNVATSLMSAVTAWGDSDTALTRDTTYIGGTPITIPTALPAGSYDMLIYEGATPAATDSVVIGKRIEWNGNQIIGDPRDI